jgi:hypothetical protein
MEAPANIEDELAGQAAYNAFLGELRAFLPHEASAWEQLPMPLKQAWTAAAIAAIGQSPHLSNPAKDGAPAFPIVLP